MYKGCVKEVLKDHTNELVASTWKGDIYGVCEEIRFKDEIKNKIIAGYNSGAA